MGLAVLEHLISTVDWRRWRWWRMKSIPCYKKQHGQKTIITRQKIRNEGRGN
jgi:hypothetical protein